MPKSVAWREGLFIRPQHFQQNDFLHMRESMQRTRMGGQNRWGLFELEIDNRLLGEGKIYISKISGIMPDGTFFDENDIIGNLSLEVSKEDGNKSIFLALPIDSQKEDSIYFEEHEPIPTRYIAKTQKDIPNINAGEESSADIIYTYLNLKLFKQDEIPSGYTSIEVVRISNVSANNSISIDKEFSPTFLHLHKAQYLSSRLDELRGMVRYRIDRLAERTIGSRLQSTELGDYLVLQLLSRIDQKLYFYATQENIHPDELFLELTSLIGEMSVFMSKKKKADNYIYTHSKQKECFKKVFDEINMLLSNVLESRSNIIPLRYLNYGLYTATLHDKSIINNLTFIVAVSSNIDGAKLKKLLLDNLKIGVVEEIKNLVNHHLPGFKIFPLSSAPREIPYKINQSYYQIVLTNDDKEKLVQSSGIALHYPKTKNMTIEFELWSIKKQTG